MCMHPPVSMAPAPRDTAIDLLRGLLALSVVVSHASIAWETPPLALRIYNDFFMHTTLVHPGVVGFIVLSGFCIHWATLNAGSLSWGPFALRRALRILPVFWAAVALGGAVLVATRGLGAVSLVDVMARSLLLAPLLPIDAPVGNSPLATVVVEMWLYALYPVLYLTVYKRRPSTMLVALLVCAALPPIFALAQFDRVWAFTNLIAYLPLWWIGVAAAEIRALRQEAPRLPSIRPWLLVVALTLAMSLISLTDRYSLAGGGLRYAFQFALALALANWLASTRPVRLQKPVMNLGAISYSLYASHYPMLAVVIAIGITGWPGFLLGLLASFLAALLMYRAVEAPSQRLARQLPQITVRHRTAAYRSA